MDAAVTESDHQSLTTESEIDHNSNQITFLHKIVLLIVQKANVRNCVRSKENELYTAVT